MALPRVMERRKEILERIQRWNSQNLIANWLDKSEEIKTSIMILDYGGKNIIPR